MRSLLSLISSAAVRAYDGGMANVVVIEDEPGIVDFIERGLTARGFNVLAARDGERGLELALGERVDLVVLDLMLPRRSGEEILHDLTEQRPGLPVIVLTARGEVEDRVNGLRAGAVDYLVKPFALAELDARIHAQLRAARQAPDDEPAPGRTVDRPDLSPGHPRWPPGPADDDRVRSARVSRAQRGPGPHPPADPAGRLGL